MNCELPEGLRYRVVHQRLIDTEGEYLPHGGRTVVEIGKVEVIFKDVTTFVPVAVGVARCSPLDNYSRKRGRDIAFGRALKRLQEDAKDENNHQRDPQLRSDLRSGGGGGDSHEEGDRVSDFARYM